MYIVSWVFAKRSENGRRWAARAVGASTLASTKATRSKAKAIMMVRMVLGVEF